MRWFQPFVASADLRHVLACRYVARPAGHHDLLPDGCMDLLWIAGVGVVLCGPDTRSWSFELPLGTEVAGVRFRPGAAADVFRLDAAALRDVRVDLIDLLGSSDGRAAVERLDTAEGPFERMAVLEALVRHRRSDAAPDDTVRLAALVASDPAYGVGRLADATGVSERQLHRRFTRAVGYGPAFFARVSRLQRFARGAARNPRQGIVELAVAAGYADQPHLAKDCRSIAALTPRQLLDVLPRTSVAVTLSDVDTTLRRTAA